MTLPVFEFTQADYQAAGGGDYGTALRNYATQRGLFDRRAYLLITPGMWGGYAAIRHARHFVFAQLYAAKHTTRHLYALSRQLQPSHLTVAVHIRRGDFRTVNESTWRGALNRALPLEWYIRVCRALNSHFRGRIQFLLFSDGSESELRGFCDEFHPLRMEAGNRSEASDLIAMAGVDLLVCSTSTFSLLAAFLSDAPYLWFEPQLESDGAFYSLANEGLTQADARCYGVGNEEFECAADNQLGFLPRGMPIREFGQLPDLLVQRLAQRLGLKHFRNDLVYYGRVPCKLASV
jgi:hypothetical protein